MTHNPANPFDHRSRDEPVLEMLEFVATFAVALAFVRVHLLGWRFHLVEVRERCAWLSAASGVWVAYVFVHSRCSPGR